MKNITLLQINYFLSLWVLKWILIQLADIGADCNIGAGTITCNYDGANKHRTIIEDNVFIGTNNSLVAPIKIGQGATTGAGSTLTRNVAEHSLAVERSKQFEKANYQRPQKLKK